MKKIFIIFVGIFAFFGATAADARRDFSFFWSENSVKLFGHHRPYSKIFFEENGEKIGETRADARGRFEKKLSLDPKTFHEITARAFDRFDREIKTKNGDPDFLKVRVLPGFSTAGKIVAADETPIAGAKIEIRDADGNLLNRVFSDENGYFSAAGVPANATVKIVADDFLENDFPAEKVPEKIRLDFSGEKKPEKKVFSPQKSPEKSGKMPPKKDFSFLIFSGILLFLAAGGGFFWWKYKKEKSDEM